jgi:hypothetical protein
MWRPGIGFPSDLLLDTHTLLEVRSLNYLWSINAQRAEIVW